MSREQEQVTRADGLGATLGETIAAYRRRHRQPHRDAPWSQEELAFASGTSQAHISRIESNRQQPELSTLLRICDALESSQAERAYVLALAGYQVAAPLPDEHAAAYVLAKVAPLIDSYPYPVKLLDDGERDWYVNRVYAMVWGVCYGATDHQECLARVRQWRLVEVAFDPELYVDRLPYWKAYCEDTDHLLMRAVAMLWRAYCSRQGDPEMSRVVARLKQNPEFVVRWEQVQRAVIDLLSVDHTTYVLNHPLLGRLRLYVWRTRATVDDRFIVVHHTPVDVDTARSLERLSELRPRR